MPFVLIDIALASNATLAIIPMQDILKLDSADRMNTPGTMEGNWQWHFNWTQLDDGVVQALEHSIFHNKRNPNALRG